MPESQLMQEWYASGGDAVRYSTLEFAAPAFSRSHYIAVGLDAVTATTETGESIDFEPVAVRVAWPEKGVQGRETLKLTLDGVGADLLRELEAQAEAERAPITMVHRDYLDSDLSTPQSVSHMTLRSVNVTDTRVTAEAAFLDAINIPFPRILYNTRTHPGLA